MELSPLRQMTDEERLVTDFHGSGMSTGPHPMTYCREALSKLQVKRACDLPRVPDGQYTRVAGCVIARQRPGTAKGFVFLSLEDETGISNVIVNPDIYEKYHVVINREKFLRVEGVLQNQDHTPQRPPACPRLAHNLQNVQQRASEDGFWQIAFVLAYSVRNACIGSIRDALHAGTRQARAATTSMDAATDAKIAGSSGRVPKSSDWIKRPAPMLATRPLASP